MRLGRRWSLPIPSIRFAAVYLADGCFRHPCLIPRLECGVENRTIPGKFIVKNLRVGVLGPSSTWVISREVSHAEGAALALSHPYNSFCGGAAWLPGAFCILEFSQAGIWRLINGGVDVASDDWWRGFDVLLSPSHRGTLGCVGRGP